MTASHTRCCVSVGRKPLQDLCDHVRQWLDLLLVRHVLKDLERLHVLQIGVRTTSSHAVLDLAATDAQVLRHPRCVFLFSPSMISWVNNVESIEHLLMPRRRNFLRIGTLHVGNDFAEGAQKTISQTKWCEFVQISELQHVKCRKDIIIGFGLICGKKVLKEACSKHRIN